ncbi:MAG: GAF domain-containing protein, partial [Candidatus Omnitrophota bacterium]
MRKNLTGIILTAGAFLAVFFFTFQIHQTSKEKILSQFNENQLQIARQTAMQIESYLRTRSLDLRSLSSPISRQNSGRERITADIQLNYERLKSTQIKDISLLDEKGTVAYSTTAVVMGENHSQDNFFSWARDPVNKGSVWIGYEKADGRRIPVTAGSPASTHFGIFLFTPLYRESTTGGRQKPGGKFAGALMFKVDLEGMLAERSLLFTPSMKLHKLWIMDKDGTVLLQSEHPEMVMRNIREKDETCNQCHASFDHVEMMLGRVDGATEYQIRGEKRKAAAFASMSYANASWIVVVNVPLDEVTAFEWENLKNTLFLLGTVVFVLGIAFFLAYRNYREKVDHETAINTLLNISLLNIHLEEQLDKMFEIIISLPWLKVEAKGCIFLVKEKSDVLVMVVQKGLAPPLATICAEVPFGRCICGRAALTGEIEFANSVDERHDNLYEGVSPHGHYCVPIKFYDKVLGVLNLYLSAGHRRDKREEEFLKAITGVMAGIIGQKRAEEALKTSEEKHRTLFESSRDAIMTLSPPSWRFTAGNPATVEMFEVCDEAAFTALGLWELSPEFQPDGRLSSEKAAEIIQTAMARGSHSFEWTHRRRGGGLFPTTVLLTRMDIGGQALLQATVRDITDQKRAQDQLIERVHQAALGAEIGVALTTGGDLRAVLQQCAEAMVRHHDAAFARIWTLNEKDNVLDMQASAGMYTHINGPHGRVPVGKFKIGMIAKGQKPHMTNEVVGDPQVGDQEWARREGMVAFAGYPLIVQDRLVGVMAMFSRNQLAETTMNSLRSVADIVALGIERKRTEESLARYSKELTALNTASDKLMTITNMKDIY